MNTNANSLFRPKPQIQQSSDLHRCLTAFDLTLLGIGGIIGAGIFVLTGIAAATHAGPSLILSFFIAGLASGFSALAYAELAASIGGCGSAYGYAFAGFGEFVAWIIGWDLLLEYGMTCSTVAAGWSGYANNALMAMGLHLPSYLIKTPVEGGIINLPAVFVILSIMLALIIGVRESARFNNIIVVIKLLAVAVFISIASFNFDIKNWHPFIPFGWQGMMSGAALIFFAYIGFDAVSTAAEEAIDPQRSVPIGIIASVLTCTLIYMIVAGLLTSIVPYTNLNVSSPVSHALLVLGYHFTGGIVALGAIAGLTTVILVMYFGITRVFLAIARDGLLPKGLAKVNPKTKTPIRIILIVGVIMALAAGLTPISHLAELVNIGTLTAFSLVCAGAIFLRITQPNMPRPFRMPWSPLLPLLGIAFCLYLMISLPAVTWLRFIIWMLIGIVIYFTYSRFHSIATDKDKQR